MGSLKGLEWTFDTAASTYEKMRPGYVDELYRSIFDYFPINESSNVVEVGIGGGQATLPFLKTGCTLTAIEYGEHLSELCREKYKDYPKFSVITNKFENVDFKNDTYNLVFSASAFHWIPQDIGYSKVFSMLKSGGAFARFANHPFRNKDNPELGKAIQALYDKYTGMSETPVEYTEEDAKTRAEIACQYGFVDIKYELFKRTRVFSAKEYITLLGTYSTHIALEEKIRKEFFSKIEQAIDDHGGKITIFDTMDLQLARKP